MAFAAIKGDGSIKAWGNPHFGGEKAPDPDSYLDQPATKDCRIQIWYGLCSYLRNNHQCYHPLHSQQQE
jgi:hypothetical protein